MKNKNIVIVIILLILIVISIITIVAVGKKADLNSGKNLNSEDEATELTDSHMPDAEVITFAVPNTCFIDETNLQLFNNALVADGYNYRLEIKYLEDLEDGEYAGLLKHEFETGDVDVAFLGLGDADGSNNVYKLIRDLNDSGCIQNLDEVLLQDTGTALYDAFPQNLWESVKCDGHIYSIPSALMNSDGVYAAFNADYIADDVIEAWDGTIEGIYEMLKNQDWNDEEFPRFQYLISGYAFDDMIGCEINYGLLFDYETLSVENPLESEKFTDYFRVLEQMKTDGYMDDNLSYFDNPGLNNEETVENIESDNFLAALSFGSVDDVFLKENITVKMVTPYLSSKINGSVGISKNTDNLDGVLEFLGLLYGDEKYGNILLYGQENTDYKVVDGVACNPDGTDLDSHYIDKLYLNLFVNIYPVKGEAYKNDRKKEFFSFYDCVRLSPFIGFEPDTTDLNNIANDLDGFVKKLSIMTVDEAVESVGNKIKSDGMDDYLSSITNQWEEYQK